MDDNTGNADLQNQLDALKAKNDELLSETKSLKALKKKIDSLGGLEELEKSIADKKKAEDDAAAKATDVEAVRTHFTTLLSQKETELTGLQQSIISEKLSNILNKAIDEAKGSAVLLEPHIKSRIKAELDGGKLKVSVLDPDGNPALVKGKEASIADLINELKADAKFARAFDATTAGGSGSRQSNGTGGGSSNPWNPQSRNLTEQMRLYRQDKALAIRLAAEQGVSLT